MTAGLARARERFLTAEPVEPGQVRDTILASWRRSREWHVAADRIDLSYVRDPDLDTPLTRSALPVLQNLRENLQGEPVSVILTDAHGVALSRLTADHDLERHLDRVQLAPGFSYAEEFAGTNGIGTALESGQAAHVFGHEHYAGQLEDLACAAVPIRHPVSGLAVGAVGLTCWRKDAGRLLIALAQQHCPPGHAGPARRQQRGRSSSCCGSTCGPAGTPAGSSFALTNDMVLMNDRRGTRSTPATRPRSSAMQPRRWPATARGRWMSSCPPGPAARMHCRPLRGKGRRRLAGGVVHVKLIEPASQAAVDTGAGSQARGSGPPWSAPVRSGCAAAVRWRRPAPRASGSRWRASPEPASWRCCGLSTGAATRPARSTCWTPPTPVITTGWRGRWATCLRARGAWSSGTSTGSAPRGFRRCG